MKKTTSERLNEIMNIRGIKQIDVVKLSQPYCKEYNIKLGRNDLSQYISGKVEPSQNKLFVLSKALGVSILWLMGLDVPIETDDVLHECQVCGFTYCPNVTEEYQAHKERHFNCLAAIKKYGFWWTNEQQENIKDVSYRTLNDRNASKIERTLAAEKICKAYFCRSLGAVDFDNRHPDFEIYTAMLLKQNHFKKKFGTVYSELVKKYGTRDGLADGRTYFDDLDSCNSFVARENEFIKKYNMLDKYGQRMVDMTVDEQLYRVENQRIEKEKNVTSLKTVTYHIPYYDMPVSAGTGQYLDYTNCSVISLSEEPPANADFVLSVSGDSMEPTFYDGDRVFVEETNTLNIGDIGIFYYDGDVYIKEYGEKGLISHNEKYKLIRGSENMRVLGKVLGRVSEEC